MVKPPAVFVAGMLRALRRAVDTDALGLADARAPASGSSTRPTWRAGTTTRWLDTSTVRGRWEIVGYGPLPAPRCTDAQIEA